MCVLSVFCIFLSFCSIFSFIQVIAILDKIKDENEKRGSFDEDGDRGDFSDGSKEDVEWEGDDNDDEGIIYVK